jgi:hypothetical protein
MDSRSDGVMQTVAELNSRRAVAVARQSADQQGSRHFRRSAIVVLPIVASY